MRLLAFLFMIISISTIGLGLFSGIAGLIITGFICAFITLVLSLLKK